MLFVFFFFKQKTAYEMRISDWSSDVCSSDLVDADVEDGEAAVAPGVALGIERADHGRDVGLQEADPHDDQGQREVEHRLARGVRNGADGVQIGRASCRERVCQYV